MTLRFGPKRITQMLFSNDDFNYKAFAEQSQARPAVVIPQMEDPKEMTTTSKNVDEFAAYISIDWADQKHVIRLQTAQSTDK